MTSTLKVVVDKQLTGWKELHEKELLKHYEEVLKVGQYPGLPQRTDDRTLGSYCKTNKCALITADSRAYTHFLEAGINAVTIRKYGHNKESDQIVYIIEIAGE